MKEYIRMKKRIKQIGTVISVIVLFAFTAASLLSAPMTSAAPADAYNDTCAGAKNAVTGACDPNTGVSGVWEAVGTITTWLLMAVGAVCVIFIVIGGIRYATSGGDTEKVKKAKNTLLYALVGLAIAILANVIVSLVTNTLGQGGIFG
jgi:hypothetical protein